jgi:hypothetical protein
VDDSGPGERPGGEKHADMGADAREAALADRVAAAAAELYGGEPEAFTERRKALAASAKSAGDRDAATAIAALRKPTRAAWVVNRLARADPDAPARLAALSAALRDAERAKDGPRLRELSAERGSLIDALTARALAAAGIPDPPSGLRDEIMATLTAAFADPATAAEFAAGTLTKAAHWSGFGFGFGAADLASADGGADSDVGADAAVSRAAGSRAGPPRASTQDRAPHSAAAQRGSAAKPAVPRQASPSVTSSAARPARPSRPSRPDGAAGSEQGGSRPRADRRAAAPPDEVAARRAVQQRRAADERRAEEEERRAAQQQERLAQEAADRAAERRKNYEDGERTVVSAATASAEAGLAEDRLAAEVRDLEERVTKAREDLAAARRRARHAEAAERRARQALERLPRP